jgi:hypothetical protein
VALSHVLARSVEQLLVRGPDYRKTALARVTIDNARVGPESAPRLHGGGWTLVGDAGHHKEFVIGDGITEALQARSLATAIARGTNAALIRWWRARDIEALPYFFLGQDEGALGPPSDLQQVVFARAAQVPDLRARLAATMDHRLSPTETFPVRHVLWRALGAAFRGSPRVLAQFIAKGKRGSAIASCVCVDGFSLRRGPPRHTPYRQT